MVLLWCFIELLPKHVYKLVTTSTYVRISMSNADVYSGKAYQWQHYFPKKNGFYFSFRNKSGVFHFWFNANFLRNNQWHTNRIVAKNTSTTRLTTQPLTHRQNNVHNRYIRWLGSHTKSFCIVVPFFRFPKIWKLLLSLQ